MPYGHSHYNQEKKSVKQKQTFLSPKHPPSQKRYFEPCEIHFIIDLDFLYLLQQQNHQSYIHIPHFLTKAFNNKGYTIKKDKSSSHHFYNILSVS